MHENGKEVVSSLAGGIKKRYLLLLLLQTLNTRYTELIIGIIFSPRERERDGNLYALRR